MAGTAWYTFAPATKIRSSEVNTNFDWLEGDIVPQIGGSTTTGVYNLGSTSARWHFAYLNGGIHISDQAMASTTILGVGLAQTDLVSILFENTNSQTSSAHVSVRTRTYGNSSGDPFHAFQISGVAEYCIGIDNSAGDVFKIVNGGDLNTVASIKISGLTVSLASGTAVNQISTDGGFSDNSDNILPTQKAVKTYVDQFFNASHTTTASGLTALGSTQLSAAVTLANSTRQVIAIASGFVAASADTTTSFVTLNFYLKRQDTTAAQAQFSWSTFYSNTSTIRFFPFSFHAVTLANTTSVRFDLFNAVSGATVSSAQSQYYLTVKAID